MGRESVTIQKDTRPGRNRPWLVRWHGEYNPHTGKQKRYCRSFKTRALAEQFAVQKQSELNNGEARDPVNITLQELCDQYLESNKHKHRHATLQNYTYTITQLLQFLPKDILVSNITLQKAEQFINSRQIIHPSHAKSGKDISTWGRNGHLRNCHAIFGSAVDWNYLKTNPFAKIKPVKNEKSEWHYFSAEEFQMLLTKTLDFRVKCFYSVIYSCGLRYGECINLCWNGRDIDFSNSRINIKPRKATKNIPAFKVKDHECRSIPMPQWLVQMLIKLQEESSPGCPFVFLTTDRWSRVQKKWARFQKEDRAHEWQNSDVANNMLRNFKGHCRKAGINSDEKITLQCLRKSYAQTLADGGCKINTLKGLMGHSSIRVTEQYYLKASDANEREAVQIIEQLMSDAV